MNNLYQDLKSEYKKYIDGEYDERFAIIKRKVKKQTYTSKEYKEIKDKKNQFYLVAEYLLKGHTWDDTVQYLLDWQKNRYNLDEKDKYTLKNDIKMICRDSRIANEIIDIALLNEKISTEYDDER